MSFKASLSDSKMSIKLQCSYRQASLYTYLVFNEEKSCSSQSIFGYLPNTWAAKRCWYLQNRRDHFLLLLTKKLFYPKMWQDFFEACPQLLFSSCSFSSECFRDDFCLQPWSEVNDPMWKEMWYLNRCGTWCTWCTWCGTWTGETTSTWWWRAPGISGSLDWVNRHIARPTYSCSFAPKIEPC